MFIQTFQLQEARAAVSDPVYTGPARFLNRQVLYLREIVPRVYTKPCKCCYRLQHCLHESTQICRPLKNLHGGSTSPMWTEDGSVQVFVSSYKRDLSLIIFAFQCHDLVWTIAYTSKICVIS